MTLPAGTRLGPYEILSPLGAGGMGEVYRARDRKLDRDVAVKVLPQPVANDPDALARFEREAKAVAALSHPNILSIHDFGTQDGTAYAVMELLEGETLRAKIDAGAVSQKRAVDWALQIAKGLSAAHERGVVHRDLKPENVFVSKSDHVKILDFGLAKKVDVVAPDEQTSAPTASGHTEPGTALGTVGYMSPEQVRGFPVDHRSDIFSFGTVLYELLSGVRAFGRRSVADTMAAILKEDPPELTQSGRNISPALDHIVRHCLEKDRDNRFQSAKDIGFALSEQASQPIVSGAPLAATPTRKSRMFVAAAAIIALAVAGLFLWSQSHRRGGEAGEVKRVAVLPFENLGASEDDYFADGVADAVRGKLTTVPGIEVIARGSCVPYRKTAKTPGQIAQELDATHLLTGTVRWQRSASASRVQVSPELVEVKKSGAAASKWQQPFDASLTDVFQVQSDIASRVVQALGLALRAGEANRLSEKPTQNLAAYDAFLRGEEASQGLGSIEPSSVRKGLEFYEQAAALDPGFFEAWARVSQANSMLYFFGTPTPAVAERARRAAEKALELAPGRSEAFANLGFYQQLVVGDARRALEYFAQGERVAPPGAELLRGMAIAESSLGSWDAAVEHFTEAERLDPRAGGRLAVFADMLLRLRRYAQAREVIGRGLSVAPAQLDLIEHQAMTFLMEGDLAGARAVLRDVPKEVEPTALVASVANFNDLAWVLDEQQRNLLVRLPPGAFDDDRGVWALCLTQAYALKGDQANVRLYAEETVRAFEEQLRSTPDNAQRHVLLGLALAYLGRKEEAIQEGLRGIALGPISEDAVGGPYNQHQLARIYALVGEPEKALDQLEPLLKIPYVLSPGWLKIDPNFDPLRSNPRFQKLVAGK